MTFQQALIFSILVFCLNVNASARSVNSTNSPIAESGSLESGVSFFTQYGIDSRFELFLSDRGDYTFSISSNLPSLFPSSEIGYWQGSEINTGRLVRERLLQTIHSSPNNASTHPGAPFIAINKVIKGHITQTGLYSLESPPSAVASALSEVLYHVNGPWRKSRRRTLLVEVLEFDARKITLQFIANGIEPVIIPSPVSRNLLELALFANEHTEPLHYTDQQLLFVVDPAINSDWQQLRKRTPLVTIPAGERIRVEVTPVGLPAKGCYSAAVKMSLLVGLSANNARDIVQGILRSDPIKWCAPKAIED